MAEQPARSMQPATLFENSTHQSTITGDQRIEIDVRYEGPGEEIDIAD